MIDAILFIEFKPVFIGLFDIFLGAIRKAIGWGSHNRVLACCAPAFLRALVTASAGCVEYRLIATHGSTLQILTKTGSPTAVAHRSQSWLD